MSGFNSINFLNQLEKKKVISPFANARIQHFFEYSYANFGKLFLVLSGLVGSLFISAGVFSIISHNWDVLPKALRGFLSLVPLLVALFFYYKAVFQKKTTVWIEVSSLFLFMMIGASIALVSSTYQLNGDFDAFIIVWLVLAIPLFYIGKASAFALFYLVLACYFAFPAISFGFLGIPTDYDYNEKIFWFYFFIAAFLPHYIFTLNRTKKKQGIRAIYLGYVLATTLFIMLPFLVKGGWLFWGISIVLGFLIFGNHYYKNNLSILSKPFQLFAFYGLFYGLIFLSTKQTLKQFLQSENLLKIKYFETDQLVYYILGVIAVIILTIYAWKTIRKENRLLKMITTLPFIVVLLMILHYINEGLNFDMRWLGQLVFNVYLLFFGIYALAKGANERRISSLLFGLLFLCFFLWVKYFDLDLSFWLKGLFFILIGLGFFLINFIYAEELSLDVKNVKEDDFEDEFSTDSNE